MPQLSGTLRNSLMLTAIVGVNNVESRKYVKPLLLFTALVALLPIVWSYSFVGSTISAIYLLSGRFSFGN